MTLVHARALLLENLVLVVVLVSESKAVYSRSLYLLLECLQCKLVFKNTFLIWIPQFYCYNYQ